MSKVKTFLFDITLWHFFLFQPCNMNSLLGQLVAEVVENIKHRWNEKGKMAPWESPINSPLNVVNEKKSMSVIRA